MIPESRKNTAWNTELLRQALLENNNGGQTCSPASTFTDAQKEKLQPFLPNMHMHGKTAAEESSGDDMKKNNNQLDILEPWTSVVDDQQESKKSSLFDSNVFSDPPSSLDWHGAPRFESPTMMETRHFRNKVRQGLFTGPTNAVCPGFLQCNLVILPQGQHAFDFLLFCQRNPKACPLIEVCEAGSPVPVGAAPDADLRTDCPKYVYDLCDYKRLYEGMLLLLLQHLLQLKTIFHTAHDSTKLLLFPNPQIRNLSRRKA